MFNEVIGTAEAARILGVTRSRIVNLIHDNVITSVYMGGPDGSLGRPGYRISVEEIYRLAEERDKERNARYKKEDQTANEEKREAICNALTDLQACLSMLSETIGKLKEVL